MSVPTDKEMEAIIADIDLQALIARGEELIEHETCERFRPGASTKTSDWIEGADIYCLECGNFEFRHIIKSLLKEVRR